jgi:CheY-like chemotaxis protein
VTAPAQTQALELLILGGAGLTPDASRFAKLSANVTITGIRPNALALLRKQGRHARAPRPALILLDLGRCGEQGWALLREIKGDPQLRRIPVIVLGASNSGQERARAYDLHANSYLPRPRDEARLGALLEQIEDFWLTKVRLPAG